MPHRSNGHGRLGLASKAHAITGEINSIKDTIEEAVERRFKMLKSASSRAAKSGRRKLVAMREKTGETVSRNPFRSVFVATGAGILLGFLLGRR